MSLNYLINGADSKQFDLIKFVKFVIHLGLSHIPINYILTNLFSPHLDYVFICFIFPKMNLHTLHFLHNFLIINMVSMC